MAFTKINAAGIGTTETVTVDGLTVINDGSFGGNLTVSGVLTYEDVTNVDSVGLITARNGIVVGSGITLSKDGDIFATGVTTTGSLVSSGAISGTTGTFTGDVDIADKIVHTGDTNTAIRFPAADTIQFETAGSARLKIDDNGKILIATDTTSEAHANQDELIIGKTTDDANHGLTIVTPDDRYGTVAFSDGSGGTSQGLLEYNHNGDYFRIYTAASERFRIDSTGRMTQNGTTSADTASALTLKNGQSGNDHTILELISDPNQLSMIYFGASDDRYQGQIRYKDNDHYMSFYTDEAERLRITSAGELLLGATASATVGGGAASLHQIETTSQNAISCVAHRGTGNASGSIFILGKSRGTSAGAVTAVASGDELGSLRFAGADGTDLQSRGGEVSCEVDGTPGSNDMPGRLLFKTTADGAASPTERLRIDSSGKVAIGNASPQQLLHVWPDTANTTSAYIRVTSGDRGSGTGVELGSDADGDGRLNVVSNAKLKLYTNNTQRFTIDESGSTDIEVGSGEVDIYSTGSGEQHSLRLLNSDASAGNEIGIYFGPANNVAGAYISGYAYGDFSSSANRDAGLRFGVRQNGTFKEVVRINDGGFFQATNIEDSYETHSFAADLGHQFNSNQRYYTTLWLRNTNNNFENGMFRCAADRAATSSYGFITCTSGDLGDDEFRVRGDGQVYADGSFNSGGADYAEYFEWTDGNSSNEDRRGMTVVLDGSKVRLSTSSDSADNIIGVVSGRPTIIGDSASEKWTGKYQKDDYNEYILDSDGYRQLSPSYDDTKTYVPREERQEWDAIGMVGKLRIRKGQQTGTRWIKMRDVSDAVEEWLVR